MSYNSGGDDAAGPPFSPYATRPDAVVECAAGILLSGGQVGEVRETVHGESRRAQSVVDGEIEIPLAQAPLPASLTADQVALRTRFAAGALSRFAVAISEYDSGVGRLNDTWERTPPQLPPDEREAIRRGLRTRRAGLEEELDGEAVAVSAMLERGPNARDIERLEAAGLMPSEDLRLGSAIEDAPLVTKVGDEYVVMGTDEDEHVQVIPNDDGSFTIRVGRLVDDKMEYRSERIPAGQNSLTIRSYGGNDVIEVPPEVRLSIRAYTGDGNDNYFGGGNPGVSVGSGGDDYIDLGAGDDLAFGGAGDDTIIGGDGKDVIDGQDGWDSIEGGDGFDTIYGGRGYDTIDGGGGGDYLEGGSGNDVIDGGAGDDSISGGRDEDFLQGGAGDDSMFGGRGRDVYDGGAGDHDHVVRERHEAYVGAEFSTSFELVGSPGSDAIELYQPDWMSDEQYAAWQERIDSDLELIRSTPSGREGLTALDDAYQDSDSGYNPFDDDKHIRIAPNVGWVPNDPGNVDPQVHDGYTVKEWMEDGGLDHNSSYFSRVGGAFEDDGLVNYEISHADAGLDDAPPVAVLYHELAHAYDGLAGGGADGEYTEQLVNECGAVEEEENPDRAEISVVGIDVDGDGDYDPLDTADGREHPGAFTENALRDDLGWDNRESYHLLPDADEDVVVIIEDDEGEEHRVRIPD